jgi:hypothetical protein
MVRTSGPGSKTPTRIPNEPVSQFMLEKYLTGVERSFWTQPPDPAILQFYTNSHLNQNDYAINYDNIRRYVEFCQKQVGRITLTNMRLSKSGKNPENECIQSGSSLRSGSSPRSGISPRSGDPSSTPTPCASTLSTSLSTMTRPCQAHPYVTSSHSPPPTRNRIDATSGAKNNLVMSSNGNPVFSTVSTKSSSTCLKTIIRVTKALRNDPSIVINNTDKNLGLAIMPTTWYVDQARIHLSDPKNYSRIFMHTLPLSTTVFDILIQGLQRIRKYDNFKSAISKFIFELCPYLNKTIPKQAKVPLSTFYMLPKVHKEVMSTRPIVASIGSVTYNASKFIDFELQRVIRSFPSILLNSLELNRHVALSAYPPGIVLYSADVAALYPNINIDDGLIALRRALLRYNRDAAPSDLVDIDLILVLSEWVLRNNYISFGDSMWLQTSGTAMGTPMAVVFANLYLLVLEWETIEILQAADPNFQLPLTFVRFIDDIFQAAGGQQNGDQFLNTFNERRTNIKLEWKSGQSVAFLDLTFTVRATTTGSRIDVSLYQKPMNRYLYIPPFSYHQRSVFTSFVFAEIRRYRLSCSDDLEFFQICEQFHHRLIARGYTSNLYHECLARFEDTRMSLLFKGDCAKYYVQIQDRNPTQITIPDPDLGQFMEFQPFRKPAHNAADNITPLIFKLPHTPRFSNTLLKTRLSFEPYFPLIDNSSKRAALLQFKTPALLCKSRTTNIQDMLIRSKFKHKLPDNF